MTRRGLLSAGLIALAAVGGGLALAQDSYSNGNPVTPADLATIQAAIPVPANNPPPSEVPTGTPGSTMTFRRGDAVQPRITRTASCALATVNGMTTCDATWDGAPFPAGTTIRLAGAPAVRTSAIGTATEAPLTCKAYSVTIAGISFRCWQAQTTNLTLALVTAGLNVSPFTPAAAGQTVEVVAIPTS